jgi:DNA-binding GntR family transcriptional regulator
MRGRLHIEFTNAYHSWMATRPQKEDGALDLALHRLRELIVSGELSPGEQIRQQEIADALGVSRVPLREALNVLAHQGMLLHRPHQGYFVAKRVPAEMAQIRRMLTLLEDEMLYSARWPDEAELNALEELNAQMREHAERSDWMGLLPLNRQFHFAIFQLSPHALILTQVARIWDMAEPFLAQKLLTLSARQRTCEDHQRQLLALRNHDRATFIRLHDEHRRNSVASLHEDPTVDAIAPV